MVPDLFQCGPMNSKYVLIGSMYDQSVIKIHLIVEIDFSQFVFSPEVNPWYPCGLVTSQYIWLVLIGWR